MLVLVVGPSGVGKDTLIAYCRSRLTGDEGFVFARRAVTRPAGDSSEDHDAMSEEVFQRNAADGDFAIHWRAHGLGYGLPASVEDDLALGRTVVVNVSRSVIEDARRRYRRVTIVSVTAPRNILAGRLHGRGREAGDDIDQRLARAETLYVGGSDVVHLDNSGPIEHAGEAMLRILRKSIR